MYPASPFRGSRLLHFVRVVTAVHAAFCHAWILCGHILIDSCHASHVLSLVVVCAAFRTQVGTFEGRWHKLKRITSLIDKLDYERTASITGTTRTSTADSGFDSVQVDENEGETSGGGADAATARGTLVRFEPAVPQCSMVHCYIQGSQARLRLTFFQASPRLLNTFITSLVRKSLYVPG